MPKHLKIGLLSIVLLAPLPSSWAMASDDKQVLLQELKVAANKTDFSNKFDAEIWLQDMSLRLREKIPLSAKRELFLKELYFESQQAKLPPELVLAVIDVESDFDTWAISSAGAQGLMQVMPFWQDEIGRPEDNLFNMTTNIRYGITILKHYLDKEDGNISNALARYNGSKGNTNYPNMVLQSLDAHWARR